MSYKIYTIDLSAVVERKEIVSGGRSIGAISFVRIPAGATFQLHLGQQAGIPITDGATSITGIVTPEDSERGIFFTNPAAQIGVTVDLLISSSLSTPGGL